MNMSGILVLSISDCVETTVPAFGIIVLEEIGTNVR